MNTYVVVSHSYIGPKSGRRLDRVQASSMSFSQSEDTNALVVFYKEGREIVGVVSDFDSVYLESAVTLAPELAPEVKTEATE